MLSSYKETSIADLKAFDKSVPDKAVATNLYDPAKGIIDVSSKRYKVEDCFSVLKTNSGSRPVYHQTKEHITAHFMRCYIALLIY